MQDVHPPHNAHTRRILTLVLSVAFFLSGCSRPAAPSTIVGAWYVNMPTAPYPYHLFVFNADGTVIQSNPDAGDPRHSNLMGAWTTAGAQVTAKLIETAADRTTHQFISRTDLAISLQVQSNKLHGIGTALVFDPAGKATGPPKPFTFDGDRILP